MGRRPGVAALACFCGLLLAWGAAQTAAQTSRPAPSDELYLAGCTALAEGRSAEARGLLADALLRRPDRPEIILRLAEAEAASGRPGEARRVLAAAWARLPHEKSLAIALARTHATAGDCAAAIALLAPLRADLDAEGLGCLARWQIDAGRTAEAEQTLSAAQERFADDARLSCLWIEVALLAQRPSVALERSGLVLARGGAPPAVHLLAARARLALGEILGRTEVRTVAGGHAGQFHGGWLLLEPAAGRDAFLCCPPESAMHAVRRAIDAGLNTAQAHLLHARLWLLAGRPQVAWSLLQAQEAALLEAGTEALPTLCEASLAADALAEHQRFVRRLAGLLPAQEGAALRLRTCLTLAERYAARGDGDLHAEYLRQALELSPRDDALRLRLADAEWDRQRCVAAAEHYRALLLERPAHPERARILGRLDQLRAERK